VSDWEHLEEAELTRCELVGYRQLGRSPVGVAVPIFSDQPQLSKSFLYQRRGSAGRIASFVRDPHLRPEQITSTAGQQISVSVGDEILHAYVAPNYRLIIAQGQQFRAELERLIADAEVPLSPFRALEIARFLEKPDLEERFGRLCFESLSMTSRNLAISWMAGSNLSAKARSGAYQALSKLDSAATVRPGAGDKPEKADQKPRYKEVSVATEIDFSQPLDALRAYGFELRRRGEIEAAITVFRRIWERFPTLVRSGLDLAHVLRKAERNAEAYELYVDLLNRWPHEIDSISEALIALRKMGYPDEALRAYETLNKAFPNDPRPLVGMGELFSSREDNVAAASAYRKAFDCDDLDVRTAINIARKLGHIISREDMLSLAKEMEERYPASWQAKQLVAELFHRCGMIDNSILTYKQAIEMCSYNPSLKLALANVYARFGMHEQAIEICRQMIKERQNPKRKVFVRLISSLEAIGQIADADEVRSMIEARSEHLGGSTDTLAI
jgi:tetratricopeptide (TPR) repeat protein